MNAADFLSQAQSEMQDRATTYDNAAGARWWRDCHRDADRALTMGGSNLAEDRTPFQPTDDQQKKHGHFVQRCGERGIVAADPWWVVAELEKAVQGQPHGLEFVTKVIPCFGRRADIWRFGLVEGIFYAAVGHDGRPRTILTKDMVRRKKRALKRLRRGIVKPQINKQRWRQCRTIRKFSGSRSEPRSPRTATGQRK